MTDWRPAQCWPGTLIYTQEQRVIRTTPAGHATPSTLSTAPCFVPLSCSIWAASMRGGGGGSARSFDRIARPAPREPAEERLETTGRGLCMRRKQSHVSPSPLNDPQCRKWVVWWTRAKVSPDAEMACSLALGSSQCQAAARHCSEAIAKFTCGATRKQLSTTCPHRSLATGRCRCIAPTARKKEARGDCDCRCRCFGGSKARARIYLALLLRRAIHSSHVPSAVVHTTLHPRPLDSIQRAHDDARRTAARRVLPRLRAHIHPSSAAASHEQPVRRLATEPGPPWQLQV